MDTERYRKGIIEAFDKLGKLSPALAEDLKPLRVEAEKESDPRKLFLMFQTLREVLAEQGGDAKTEFIMQGKNGVQFKVKNIQEAQELQKNYSNMTKPQGK